LVAELAEAQVIGKRPAKMHDLATVPLLIIDDLGMRKLPPTAAEGLLELIMRRYERHSTVITSNRRLSRTGARSLGTWPPPEPCSIGCSTTATSSTAVPKASGRTQV